ncbi:hypothetical protein Tco_0874544 [Tanacetum coccineum]|uniref:Uncharacterized protein n=1 Tax=Tanacetum coccineum TaxID=301880 RepID=A0ABQ5BPX5_9ASTR
MGATPSCGGELRSTHQQDENYKEDVEVADEHRQSNSGLAPVNLILTQASGKDPHGTFRQWHTVGREWAKAMAWLLVRHTILLLFTFRDKQKWPNDM